MFVTAVAGVLAEADADAGLRDVLARVLEANERWEQLAAELDVSAETLVRNFTSRFRGNALTSGCAPSATARACLGQVRVSRPRAGSPPLWT